MIAWEVWLGVMGRLDLSGRITAIARTCGMWAGTEEGRAFNTRRRVARWNELEFERLAEIGRATNRGEEVGPWHGAIG